MLTSEYIISWLVYWPMIYWWIYQSYTVRKVVVGILLLLLLLSLLLLFLLLLFDDAWDYTSNESQTFRKVPVCGSSGIAAAHVRSPSTHRRKGFDTSPN